MSKRTKVFLICIIGIFAFVLTGLLFLMGIRGEFKTYLRETYPSLSFAVEFTKIDPIYGKFYSKATCLNDYVSFPISKSFKTKQIYEDYPQYKSQIQYNLKIRGMIEGSEINSFIRSVSGGGKIPFENGNAYTQINMYLTENADAILVATKFLSIIKENNISTEKIILIYERDKHIFEMVLSSGDYDLSADELQQKIKMIK
ncbi:MAG: hypothetical protein GX295_01595 [Syntrophomonadaceae bacterium]|nr:hypothetical protein [Syntrophomonadaceae bacterium]